MSPNNPESSELLKTFVGEKFAFYDRKWAKNNSWNFAAFFLGPIWMLYRKMYLYSAIYVAVMVVIGVTSYLFEFPRAVDSGINIFFLGLCATQGNKLYKHFVEKKIQLISSSASGNELKIAVARAGGTALSGNANPQDFTVSYLIQFERFVYASLVIVAINAALGIEVLSKMAGGLTDIISVLFISITLTVTVVTISLVRAISRKNSKFARQTWYVWLIFVIIFNITTFQLAFTKEPSIVALSFAALLIQCLGTLVLIKGELDLGLNSANVATLDKANGTPVKEHPMSPNDPVSSELLKTFVGEKFAVYDRKWAKNNSLNFAAGFLGPFWLAYRKMYLYSAIYIAFHIVVMEVLDYLVELPLNVYRGIGFAEIALGLVLGNKLYKHFVEKKIKLISSSASGDELKIAVAREGGTNLGAIGLLALGVAGYAYYIYYSVFS